MINMEAYDEPDKILAFATKEKLLEILRELPEDQVVMVGYYDEEEDVYKRLTKADLTPPSPEVPKKGEE